MRGDRGPLQKIRRLLKVLQSLQAGRGYNARELAELCGVTRRQIFRDLKTLEASGIRIHYDARQQTYALSESTFLPPTALSLEETLALLLLAINLGDKDNGIPLQDAARDAALKLLSGLPSGLRQHLGDSAEFVQIWADSHHPLTDSRSDFELLQQALRERRRVRLKYDSLFEKKSIRTLLSPYRLLFSRRSWYAIGRSSLHRAVRTFHLGRIEECELTDDPYDIPPRFSLERHFGNAWNMIRDIRNRADVVVRFQPMVAQNVAEVIWHKTQRIIWNTDGTMDFRVRVDGIDEISWWILGYGDQAEVLEPPQLREKIAEHVKRMSLRYRPSRKRKETGTGTGKAKAPAKSSGINRR